MRSLIVIGALLLAAPALAAVEAPPAITQATYIINAGATFNVSEGNSSTRLFGATANVSREGRRNFATLLSNGQYGVTRTPSIVADPRGETEQARRGTPGTWEFDENINNWLGQLKYGHYLSQWHTNYLYILERVDGNRFAGFWERYETQFGYGRKVSVDGWMDLNLEVGPDFNEEHQTVGRVRSRVAVAANVLATVKLSERSNVTQELTHLRTVRSNVPDSRFWADHRTRSTTNLVLNITRRFHFQLSAGIDYASVPAPGAHPLDVRLSNALLYSLAE